MHIYLYYIVFILPLYFLETDFRVAENLHISFDYVNQFIQVYSFTD